jgi:DNA-binding HxlR family transcriptional regulator
VREILYHVGKNSPALMSYNLSDGSLRFEIKRRFNDGSQRVLTETIATWNDGVVVRMD